MQILKNIYNYRELLKTNVQKEIRGRFLLEDIKIHF